MSSDFLQGIEDFSDALAWGVEYGDKQGFIIIASDPIKVLIKIYASDDQLKNMLLKLLTAEKIASLIREICEENGPEIAARLTKNQSRNIKTVNK